MIKGWWSRRRAEKRQQEAIEQADDRAWLDERCEIRVRFITSTGLPKFIRTYGPLGLPPHRWLRCSVPVPRPISAQARAAGAATDAMKHGIWVANCLYPPSVIELIELVKPEPED